jgi:hypothetical protein
MSRNSGNVPNVFAQLSRTGNGVKKTLQVHQMSIIEAAKKTKARSLYLPRHPNGIIHRFLGLPFGLVFSYVLLMTLCVIFSSFCLITWPNHFIKVYFILSIKVTNSDSLFFQYILLCHLFRFILFYQDGHVVVVDT